MKPLTELFPAEKVIKCDCGSTAFFNWCVQVIVVSDSGPGPRYKDWTESNDVRVCVNCHRPVMVYQGEPYDASMYVSSEQIGELIKTGQARVHAVPIKGMDP